MELNRVVLGATLAEWMVALSIGVAIALGLIGIVKLIRRWAGEPGPDRAWPRRILSALAGRTRAYVIVTVTLYATLTARDFPASVLSVIVRITVIVVLLQIVQWGESLIGLWADHQRDRRSDAAARARIKGMAVLARVALWIIVALVALDNLGVEITALVAGLGIGGIAIALAIQSILKDLFAYLAITLDDPFEPGHFLVVGEYKGTVENIGLKTTRLRSLTGEQIIFSNDDLLSSRIRNYQSLRERRATLEIGVTYETPHEKLARIPEMIREIVEAESPVRFDRAHFTRFGDHALVFEAVYHVLGPDYTRFLDVQQSVNLALSGRFEAEGIEFAYPTQTIRLDRG